MAGAEVEHATSVLRPFAIAHVPDPIPLGPLASSQVARLGVNAAYFDALLSLIPSKFFSQLVKTDTDEPDERFYKVRLPRGRVSQRERPTQLPQPPPLPFTMPTAMLAAAQARRRGRQRQVKAQAQTRHTCCRRRRCGR
jgi:hypothetical protein